MANLNDLKSQLVSALVTAYPDATNVMCTHESAGASARFGEGTVIRTTISGIVGGDLYYASTNVCVVQDLGGPNEAAGWLEKKPEILIRPPEAAPNAPIEEVEGFIETRPGELADVKWINSRVTLGSDAATFQAEFYLPTGEIEPRMYKIHKDEKGAFSLARVKL